ncbi:MAG: hypothetical protein OEY28_09095, partial [Nitrospira sp.]|nr:hypothetical protein [Nitrospira sp.]
GRKHTKKIKEAKAAGRKTAARTTANPSKKTRMTKKAATKATTKKKTAKKTVKAAAETSADVIAATVAAPAAKSGDNDAGGSPVRLNEPDDADDYEEMRAKITAPFRRENDMPKPGASGMLFDDEEKLENYDPLFDEIEEEYDE